MEEEHNLNLKAELCKLGSFGNIHDEYIEKSNNNSFIEIQDETIEDNKKEKEEIKEEKIEEKVEDDNNIIKEEEKKIKIQIIKKIEWLKCMKRAQLI